MFSSTMTMKALSTCCKTRFAVVCAITVYLNAAITVAMQVMTTGPQTIQKAQNEMVKLTCTYTPGPTDTGDLDIEWSNVSPDMTKKDQVFLSYTGGNTYALGDPNLMKRLNFTGDPKQGDASIAISGLQGSDTGTYQCKVKKTPGVDMIKLTLVVMVRPSIPICMVMGSQEKGGTVSLHCQSSQGSKPLNYMWSKENGAIPPTASQNLETGELQIKNHSESYAGNYMCEVKNTVGKEQCKFNLRADNPVNKAGVIAGAVIGALLLLLLLLFLIWLLVCLCHKRCYEKEVAHEIKEDAQAPESRPSSRTSSYRSIMGYRPHAGVAYSSVRNGQFKRGESINSNIYTDKSKTDLQANRSEQKPPVLKYDSRYGYPV